MPNIESDLEKPTSTNESGVLAFLWRKVLKENRLIPALTLLINRYVDEDEVSNRVMNVKKKNRSTLVNNITASEMTFKTFLDLMFNFLRIKKLDITIKLTMSNGRESTHSVSIPNPNSESKTRETTAVENGGRKE